MLAQMCYEVVCIVKILFNTKYQPLRTGMGAVADAGFVKQGFQIYGEQSAPQNFSMTTPTLRQKGRPPSNREIPKYQSTLRPPEVHMFYRKIICIVYYMGVGYVRTACCLTKNNCVT